MPKSSGSGEGGQSDKPDRERPEHGDRPDHDGSKPEHHESAAANQRTERATGADKGSSQAERAGGVTEARKDMLSNSGTALNEKRDTEMSFHLDQVASGSASAGVGKGERTTTWLGGDNWTGIAETAQKVAEGALALIDLGQNFYGLTTSDLSAWEDNGNLDKYFHCQAHCQATGRGPGGEAVSSFMGPAIEAWDMRRDTLNGSASVTVMKESREDMAANRAGASLSREFGYRGDRCSSPCRTYSRQLK